MHHRELLCEVAWLSPGGYFPWSHGDLQWWCWGFVCQGGHSFGHWETSEETSTADLDLGLLVSKLWENKLLLHGSPSKLIQGPFTQEFYQIFVLPALIPQIPDRACTSLSVLLKTELTSGFWFCPNSVIPEHTRQSEGKAAIIGWYSLCSWTVNSPRAALRSPVHTHLIKIQLTVVCFIQGPRSTQLSLPSTWHSDWHIVGTSEMHANEWLENEQVNEWMNEAQGTGSPETACMHSHQQGIW